MLGAIVLQGEVRLVVGLSDSLISRPSMRASAL